MSIRSRYKEKSHFDGLKLLEELRSELEKDLKLLNLNGCSADAVDDVIEAAANVSTPEKAEPYLRPAFKVPSSSKVDRSRLATPTCTLRPRHVTA